MLFNKEVRNITEKSITFQPGIQTMKVVSFDCGTQNLSWCVYDADAKTIVDWQLQDITHPPAISMNEHLFRKLDEWGFQDISTLTAGADKVHIVIEKQPFRNAICKNIEAALHNYFIIRGKVDCPKKVALNRVCTYNPKHKLAGQKIVKGKKAYAERKQRSITLVEQLECVQNTKWQDYLKKLSKKDDVCDSLLQAIAYCKQKPAEMEIQDSVTAVIARKPKDGQELTTANCKYLLKQLLYPRLKKQRIGALERLPGNVDKNPKLKEVIKSNYKNLDDALKTLRLIT